MHPQMTRKPPFSRLFRHKETGPITDTLSIIGPDMSGGFVLDILDVFVAQPESKPSAAGSLWKGGATE